MKRIKRRIEAIEDAINRLVVEASAEQLHLVYTSPNVRYKVNLSEDCYIKDIYVSLDRGTTWGQITEDGTFDIDTCWNAILDNVITELHTFLKQGIPKELAKYLGRGCNKEEFPEIFIAYLLIGTSNDSRFISDVFRRLKYGTINF